MRRGERNRHDVCGIGVELEDGDVEARGLGRLVPPPPHYLEASPGRPAVADEPVEHGIGVAIGQVLRARRGRWSPARAQEAAGLSSFPPTRKPVPMASENLLSIRATARHRSRPVNHHFMPTEALPAQDLLQGLSRRGLVDRRARTLGPLEHPRDRRPAPLHRGPARPSGAAGPGSFPGGRRRRASTSRGAGAAARRGLKASASVPRRQHRRACDGEVVVTEGHARLTCRCELPHLR